MTESIVSHEARNKASTYASCPYSELRDALHFESSPSNTETTYPDFKPVHLGLLSHATTTILDTMCDTPLPSDRSPVKKFLKRFYQGNGFSQLYYDGLERAGDSVDAYYETTDAATLDDIARSYQIRDELHEGSFRPEDALQGGAETAIFWSTRVLQLLTKPTSKLPASKREQALRGSFVELRKFASITIEQLLMLEAGANSRDFIHGELRQIKLSDKSSTPGNNLRPKLSEDPLDVALNPMMVEHAYRHGRDVKNLKTVGDLAPHNPVIGCPILLKPKTVQKLWNWQIDNAVARGLIKF